MIDAHAHIHSFSDRHLINKEEPIMSWQEAFEIAKHNGITSIMNVLNIAEEHEMYFLPEMFQEKNLYLAIGVHPCYVQNISIAKTIEIIHNNIDKIYAIGEIGLDSYHESNASLEIQTMYLLEQIKIAVLYNKPVVLHIRPLNNDELIVNILIDILNKYPKIKFMMHCCTLSLLYVEKLLQFENCYISLSGIVTYKNALHVKEVAKNIPLDKLLIETDSPFLTPYQIENRSKINNQPSFIKHTYEYIAQLRSIDMSNLISIVTENFHRFISK